MALIEQRIFRLQDDIARLDEEIRLTGGELEMLRHIDDDAQRDAAGGTPLDRDDARITLGDVVRFEKALADLVGRRERLQLKRLKLLRRLG
ncbi:hypothetical protein HQ535_05325 [bacterium]|nr:hypothetical protein [bacterium]